MLEGVHEKKGRAAKNDLFKCLKELDPKMPKECVNSKRFFVLDVNVAGDARPMLQIEGASPDGVLQMEDVSPAGMFQMEDVSQTQHDVIQMEDQLQTANELIKKMQLEIASLKAQRPLAEDTKTFLVNAQKLLGGGQLSEGSLDFFRDRGLAQVFLFTYSLLWMRLLSIYLFIT